MEVLIAKIIVKITNIFTRFLPVNNKQIAIISYFNEELGLEFNKLVNLLEKNYTIKTNLRKFDHSLVGKFKYLFSFIYQTYLFNTSKVVLLDGNNFVYANIETKKEVKTIQLWHSLGAIKNFGVNTNRRYKIKEYDYVISPSKKFNEIYAKSFNTNIEKIMPLGNLKSDYLFDEKYLENSKKSFYKKYPELAKKNLILYAPTFRGEGIDDINCSSSNLDNICNLVRGYKILYKAHPLSNDKSEKLIDVSSLDLYELLSVVDIVISDYSSLVFDAMALNKKVILYLYDYQEYLKTRGICIDLNDIDQLITYDEKSLIELVKKVDVSYSKFYNEYLEMIDGKSTKRIYEFINEVMEEGKIC